MNGSINFYPTAECEPDSVTTPGHGHLHLDGRDAYSPILLFALEDVDYLDALAAAASELAAKMRAEAAVSA